MPTYKVKIAEKTYTVEVPNPNERPVRAIVDGEDVLVDVEQETVVASPGIASAPQPVSGAVMTRKPLPTASKQGDITAPLPGTVVNIGVSEGDRVERGQELCVIEAMKMNNPIRATQAGTVEVIHVHIGEQIQHGTPLMRIGD